MSDLLNKTIPEIHDFVRKGEASYAELFEETRKRIDNTEKDIKAYLTLDLDRAEEKSQDANAADAEHKSLIGIPASIKDTFVTKGVRTTVASRMLEDFVPEYSATSYERLVSDGAVMVGKTNMDEFAHGFTCEYSAFQTTRNPWNLNCVPGGSSGGGAASVAARTSLIALASENFGSIVQPAALCGVVGFKPTYGRASRYGIIAMASSLESPGIIARCVEDAAIGVESIIGIDPRDATTLDTPKEKLLANLNRNIKGKKIAVIKPIMEIVDSEIVEAIESALDTYKRLGAEIVEIDWYDLDRDLKIYDVLYRSEVASNLARYDGIRYGYRTDKAVKSLEELYKENRYMFGEHVKRQIMTSPLAIDEKRPEESIYYQTLKLRRKNQEYIDELFEEFDAIVTPASTFIELEIGKSADEKWRAENRHLAKPNGASLCPTVLYGYPAISFPIGFSAKDMPIGIHMYGKRLGEQGILNLAYAFQEETGLKCLDPYPYKTSS